MKLERIAADDPPETVAAQLRELIPHAQSVSETVAEIIAQVRSHGDGAARPCRENT